MVPRFGLWALNLMRGRDLHHEHGCVRQCFSPPLKSYESQQGERWGGGGRQTLFSVKLEYSYLYSSKHVRMPEGA